ncbi:DUF1353 domain-containing protein [Spartinivicinus poritis]|uniref:DUF1353 domain-containing protein n=1 Tax=Spartinivicinus poritis TaxID=2994640 RepID=A0ABT5UFZ5_9GAMM|nr:DUF1353 domain-containing protein [Spartinivicinus sp. A2-2]MDE1465311.1 DUF1353 domain-containing protein [Spartinivicinus sp. A2-2]
MFLNRIKLEHIPNKRKWVLTEELKYYSAQYQTITVPAGFTTDLASIPRLLWSVFPPDGPYLEAAVLHDYLYSKQPALDISRKQADKVFLKAMRALGVPGWKRYSIYYGVRLGGKASWNKK